MGCNCKGLEVTIALVILVVTIWPIIFGASVSWWIVVVAAALLLIHALKCKNCKMHKSVAVPKRKIKKKKR